MDARSPGLLRPATSADAGGLLALYDEFHAFHVAGVRDRLRIAAEPMTVQVFAEQLAPIFVSEDALMLVLEGDGGDMVGVAEAYFREEPELDVRPARRHVHVQSLIVTERFRRSGAGRRLMAAVEVWAAQRGATEVDTDIWEFADGPLGFYEKLGYRVLRRTLVKTVETVGVT